MMTNISLTQKSLVSHKSAAILNMKGSNFTLTDLTEVLEKSGRFKIVTRLCEYERLLQECFAQAATTI